MAEADEKVRHAAKEPGGAIFRCFDLSHVHHL